MFMSSSQLLKLARQNRNEVNRFEINLILYLGDLETRQQNLWRESLKPLFKLIEEAEKAYPDDPRALRFVGEMLTQADEEFFRFLGQLSDLDLGVEERNQIARALGPLAAQYVLIKSLADAVSAALREHDECLYLLPQLAYYHPTDTDTAQAVQASWKEIVPAMQELLRLIGQGVKVDNAWSSKVQNVTSRVTEIRRDLERKLTTVPVGLSAPALHHTLGIPILKAEERASRWATASSMSRQELALTPPRPDRLAPLIRPEAGKVENGQFHLARRAADLLKLGRHPDAQAVENALAQEQPDRHNCQKLRDLLGAIWTAKATQLVRTDHLWYVPAVTKELQRDPVLKDYQDSQDNARNWLAARYRQLGNGMEKINHKDLKSAFVDLAEKALKR